MLLVPFSCLKVLALICQEYLIKQGNFFGLEVLIIIEVPLYCIHTSHPDIHSGPCCIKVSKLGLSYVSHSFRDRIISTQKKDVSQRQNFLWDIAQCHRINTIGVIFSLLP